MPRSIARIDPIVALIMAVGRSMTADGRSYLEDNDVLSF
jgi:hypothetical protein